MTIYEGKAGRSPGEVLVVRGENRIEQRVAGGDIKRGEVVAIIGRPEDGLVAGATKDTVKQPDPDHAKRMLRDGLANFFASPLAVEVLERSLFESDPEVIAYVYERSESRDRLHTGGRGRAPFDRTMEIAWSSREPHHARVRAHARALGIVASLQGKSLLGMLDPQAKPAEEKELFPEVTVPRRRHFF